MIFRYQSGTRLASGGDGTTTGDWQVETVTSSRDVTLAYTAANLLATQSGVISGTGGLTYTNAGTLTLSAANTFSGALTVNDGAISVATVNNASTDDPLGNRAGAVVLGSSGKTGTLIYSGATAFSTKPFTAATGGTAAFSVA